MDGGIEGSVLVVHNGALLGDLATVDSAVADAQGSYDLAGALAYIHDKWAEFQNIGGVIVNLQHQAALTKIRALQLGQTDIAADMDARITQLGDLDDKAGYVLDEVDMLDAGLANLGLTSSGAPMPDSAIPDSAFGQEPVTIAGAALLAGVIVGYMTYVIWHKDDAAADIAARNKVLDMVQSKTLTPQQGTDILAKIPAPPPPGPGVFDSLKGIAGYLALGAVAIFAVPELSKAMKRRR